MAQIIQLSFDKEYDKCWWIDQHLWETRTDDGEEEPSTVYRPTEISAFRHMYRQSRYVKRGVYINLTPLHIQAMKLEHRALSKPPYPDKVYVWISDRMPGVPPTQVKFLLDECSVATMMREVLGMSPLLIDWELDKAQPIKRAA